MIKLLREFNMRQRRRRRPDLKEGAKDWWTPCIVCDQIPTVHPTGLCGPCTGGEAETVGGNW